MKQQRASHTARHVKQQAAVSATLANGGGVDVRGTLKPLELLYKANLPSPLTQEVKCFRRLLDVHTSLWKAFGAVAFSRERGAWLNMQSVPAATYVLLKEQIEQLPCTGVVVLWKSCLSAPVVR